jgi:Bacterial regulatory helix-turn-helix protein, lysR family
VIQSGSFDAAAEWLHVTPSAISQRIKTLEQRIGQVWLCQLEVAPGGRLEVAPCDFKLNGELARGSRRRRG